MNWSDISVNLLTYTGVAWSEELGLWVACATNGTIIWSRDGVTWYSITDFSTDVWNSLIYGLDFSGNSVFLIGGDSRIIRSINGISYNAVVSTQSKKLLYGDGYFYNIKGDQYVFRSNDGGNSWLQLGVLPYNGSNIYIEGAFGKGILVAIASSPNDSVAYSTNYGDTWSQASIASHDWSSVVFDGTVFILTSGPDDVVFTSPDGSTWTLQSGTPRMSRLGTQNGFVLGAYYGDQNIYITNDNGVTWAVDILSSVIDCNTIGCKIAYIAPTTTSTTSTSTTSTSTSSTTSTSTSSTTSTSTSSTTSTSTSSTTSTSTSSTTSTSTSSTTSTSTSSTSSTSTSSTSSTSTTSTSTTSTTTTTSYGLNVLWIAWE